MLHLPLLLRSCSAIWLFLFFTIGWKPSFAQEKRFTFEQGAMGSPFRLVFYASNDSLASQAAHAAFRRIRELNDTLSDYRDGSEINRLSAESGSGKWVPVSRDLFDILAVSRDIAKKTDGAFDITLGPVVRMWRNAVRKSEFPSRKTIRCALAKTGYRHMKLDTAGRRVKITKKGMRLDVGGLGKGYAAEKAMKVLQQHGIISAMIDAGGKLVLTNPPPGEKGWKITVSNGSDSLETLVLANTAVATSGPTYRHFDYKGVRYSHIVNPKTGIGLLFHVRTTALCADGTLADALATAFSVLGVEKSKKIISRFPGTKVWLVEKQDGRLLTWKTLD